ncbi:UNVERIFIED_CONTAM: DNA polymerase alpha catalytic subunit [Sesamum calycinum]|uniref:DNA polymerase n=1 Tax=Sesamum calycinum TaxID=2727403 RepID=A0AAW2MMZ2_9LAMI
MDEGGFQIKMEQPIYDTVDEEEVRDEGQEEDWSLAGVALSSEESDGESERPKKKKNNSNSDKKEKVIVKKPSALASAAALMGKQRISNMFTSSVFKKDKQTNVSCDSIVDDVIAEFAPDENDRERRRRTNSSNSQLNNLKNFTSPTLGILPVKIEKPAISSVNLDARDKTNEINSSHPDVHSESWRGHSELGENIISEDNTLTPSERVTNSFDGIKNEEIKENSEPIECGKKECSLDMAEVKEVPKKSTNSEEKLDFEVESDGSLPFYILDAHEEIHGTNAGNLYLFGKVKSGGTYHSCCVVVKNMQRCVYAIPTVSFMHNDTITELEKNVEESRLSLMASKDMIAKQGRDGEKSRMSSTDLKDTIAKLEKNVEESQKALRIRLHDLASDLKTEMTNELLDRNVSSFSMAPVKRNYAFERSDLPRGENYVLKINYPFKDPPLPSDLKGNSFCALLGTHNSAMELFLIKRKIKGPSWLSISKFCSCAASQRVSWCKFEVTVDFPKDIQVSTSSKNISDIPPVVVTAINLKTIINEKQNVNEIVSASVICCHRAKIDAPMVASEWTRPGMLSHFTVVRKLEGGIFPMGFTKETADKNAKAGSNVICYETSERALLNRLMTELHKLDSDVLVGHNISGFDLDVLLHRVQVCRVPSSMWSKIGRLKRSTMPKLNKGSSVFGSGASSGIMSCIAGRLLCDTYICSRDLLKEVSYSLTQLAKTQLNKDRKEITPHDIPQMFQSSESLMELVEYGETDAWLSMELMFLLSVLPLTRQLTNISGNLWHKTLQGARAQRVEYLLLHAFHAKKFIVPDKFSSQSKETWTTKRKISSGVESKEIDPDSTNLDDEPPENYHGKTKKGPSYSGGLVLEPKKGLYDKYILLLDFNSLYPSIIQEYNICFTTVERSADGSAPRLPSTKRTGVLPELLKNLVERRRMVKSWLKTATGLKVQQLDIQQQALKLTANSMYGCLGFSNSRFYAKPLAELITLQGREILQSTVNLVQNVLNLEVIYGDTDSIMIYSGLDDIGKAKLIAGKVIQEVNKKYRCLEIDLDGLYKRMLLLKKKKYAAVKMHFKDGTSYEVIERKGLDRSCEDVVEAIHNSLMKRLDVMSLPGTRGNEEWTNTAGKYVITKTLTKPPEAYPDARISLMWKLKRSGYVTGCSAGDTVPYIICCEQIHPVISRLCASIQGTSPSRLADCLGLDSSKFQNKSIDSVSNDPSSLLSFALDDEESCSGTFECSPILSSVCAFINTKPADMQAGSTTIFWQHFRCPKCPEEGDGGRISPAIIANQCDDETCNYATRSVNLRVLGDSERGTTCPNYPRCNGHLMRKYTEAELYRQLSYFCYTLDTVRCIDKIEGDNKMPVEKELAKIRPLVEMAASTVQKIRNRCAYGWVKLEDLIVLV